MYLRLIPILAKIPRKLFSISDSSLGCSALFPIFSYQSGPKLFGMPNFGYSTLFFNLSHQSSLKSFGMPNFCHSSIFLIFLTKRSEMIHNAQLWLFHTFPHLLLTKLVHNHLKCPIVAILHCFPIFWHQCGQKNEKTRSTWT